ncbi:MAG: hypothetical protein QOG25_708, partial [Acetobacteraceae bacterium]|nr:hypothetical protein [Acetobacteraceae bacterium]
MITLADGSAGLALVASIALLCTWRLQAASSLLAAQSAAVAVTALLLSRPLMALPPLLFASALLAGSFFGGGAWFARHRATADGPATSTLRGLIAGAVLTVLCLSQDTLGLPLAIVTLAILFAVTRPHPPLQVMALIALQNGLVLVGCLGVEPAILSPVLLPVVCFVLPLPLAAHLLIPVQAAAAARADSGLWRIDLALSIAMFAATLIIPLDGLASVFAPLLGFDAVMRSWARRTRNDLPPPRRAFALLQSGLILLAVCAPNVIVAWVAVCGAMAALLLPRLRIATRSPMAPLTLGITAEGSPALTTLPNHVFQGAVDRPALAVAISSSLDQRSTAADLLPLVLPRADRFIPVAAEVVSRVRPSNDDERDGLVAHVPLPCPRGPGADGPTSSVTMLGRPVPAGTVSSGRAPSALAMGRATRTLGGAEPTLTRRWDEAFLAFTGAGIALFGLLMLPSLPSALGYFSVFAGFIVIAAIIPDLAVVLVFLVLRLATQTQWPAGAEALGIGIALIALFACALRLMNPPGQHRATLLQLGQCSVVLLALCLGEADGRFAALVLMVLLILTGSAARLAGGL